MRFFPVVVVMIGAVACAGSPPPAKSAHKSGSGRGEVEVPRTVVTPNDASSIPELLRDAAALATAERWKEAAAAYERAYQLEPEGASGDEALWGAAEAHDHGNDLERALSRYELVAQRQPGTERGRAALVRATRLLVFLGRFRSAGVYAERLLKRPEQLNDFERIAVLSARAHALIENGEDQQASYYIEKARDIVEANKLDAAGRVPRDLAQLYYALGESRRLKAERVVFQPMPANFGAVLEERCQLLLDAQSAYSDSMRAYDAHWSAMAGFRTAELYQRLHQDLMAVQPPANADTERKRQLFEGAVRTRYAILLTKAKGMAEHTLAMAERTGEHSQWVDRTREALKSIDQGIADEEAALAKLPYTKADFEAYFAQMDSPPPPASASTKPNLKPPASAPAPSKATSPKPANPAGPKPATGTSP
jgi:tetratricopeptide (TPR) repeat protein